MTLCVLHHDVACRLHPAHVHLTVALVEYKTPYGRKKRGLCSRYLAAVRPGERVAVWAERGTLRMPSSTAIPLILIGPGTGVRVERKLLCLNLLSGNAVIQGSVQLRCVVMLLMLQVWRLSGRFCKSDLC